MKKINLRKLFWIFMISCILGWTIEVLFAYITMGTFQNRSSFIYGPIGGAYGFGSIVLTISLYIIRYILSKVNQVLLFICHFMLYLL